MSRLAELHARLIAGLAGLAAAMLAAIVVAIVLNVGMRGLGLQPPAATSAVGEFSLLFATMLAAPWLVRRRGHIVVESLLLVLPAGLRRWIERGVYLFCAGLCAVLAWVAFDMAVASFIRGDIDIRAIDMPRWLPLASLVVGFGLMAIEFLFLLAGRGSLYSGTRGGISDSL